jgi:hypothetical protein
MRNRPDVSWVYIDSVNPEIVDWQCGGIYLQGVGDAYELHRGTWCMDGRYQLSRGSESPMDLTVELGDRVPTWGDHITLIEDIVDREDVPWYI